MLANSITFIHTIQSGKAKNPPSVPSDLELVEKYATVFKAPLPFKRGQPGPTMRRLKTRADV
jgi:hypothetical protein